MGKLAAWYLERYRWRSENQSLSVEAQERPQGRIARDRASHAERK